MSGGSPGNSLAFALTGADNRNYYLSLADSSQGAGLGPQLDIATTVGAPTFQLAASPSSFPIAQGSQATSTLTSTISGGFSSAINLSASGVPNGTTLSFSPNPIAAPGNGSSTMTITVGANTAVGTYPITVTGNGGGIQQNTTVTLTVTNVVQHMQVTADTDDVFYDPLGLSGAVWNVSGALNYNHTSFAGSWNGLVDAFSTGVRYSAVALPQGTQILSATLSIYGGTMPLVNGPSRIRIYGEASDEAPPWADADGSRPDSIPFTTAYVDYTGVDPWTGSWHPIDVTPIVQEIVNRVGWQPGNSLAFALTGADNRNYYLSLADSSQGAGLGPQLDIATTVGAPTFQLAASPDSLTVLPGDQVSSTITPAISGGFNNAITLSASGVPNGTTVSFSSNPIAAPGNGSSTMTINVGSNTAVGIYPITVTGDGGGIRKNTVVTLVVTQLGITPPGDLAVADGGPAPVVDAVQSYINPTYLTVHTTAPFNSSGGDLVIMYASSHAGVTMTPSDNYNNTWLTIAGPTDTSTGFDLHSQIWYVGSPSVGPNHTVSLTLSAPQSLVMSIFVIKGSNISSPLDAVSLIGSDNGTQSVNVVSPALTTTMTNDLLLGWAKVSAGATFTSGPGFVQQQGASSNFLDAESGTASTPGSHPATLTISSSQTWQSAVVAANNHSNQTTLTWTASTEYGGTIAEYLVERCQGVSCNNFAQIGMTPTTSYNDDGLTASTNYSYRLRAEDTNNNLGPYSSVVSITAPPVIPSLPGDLTAASPSQTEIDLSWVASTETNGSIGKYLVERCTGASCSNFSQLGTTTDTTFSDRSLPPDTTYTYRVRAEDTSNNVGPYSNLASGTTLP